MQQRRNPLEVLIASRLRKKRPDLVGTPEFERQVDEVYKKIIASEDRLAHCMDCKRRVTGAVARPGFELCGCGDYVERK